MAKKKFGRVEPKLKLRCPNCRQRINHGITSKELRQYGHSMLPKLGDLTSCDGCGVTLEYSSDPAALVLKLAPQWRVDQLNDADTVPDHPSLSELVERVRKGKTLN